MLSTVILSVCHCRFQTSGEQQMPAEPKPTPPSRCRQPKNRFSTDTTNNRTKPAHKQKLTNNRGNACCLNIRFSSVAHYPEPPNIKRGRADKPDDTASRKRVAGFPVVPQKYSVTTATNSRLIRPLRAGHNELPEITKVKTKQPTHIHGLGKPKEAATTVVALAIRLISSSKNAMLKQ